MNGTTMNNTESSDAALKHGDDDIHVTISLNNCPISSRDVINEMQTKLIGCGGKNIAVMQGINKTT